MSKYESPNYQVLHKERHFEIRQYDTYYTSKVSEQSLLGKNGFGVLFSYIGGQNVQHKKLSMTVPVINELKEDMSMEFVVPKEYYDDIPAPTDDRVSIKKHPKSKVAVYKFSGRTNSKKLKKKQSILMDWIAKQDLLAKEPFTLARYNPPFIPPFLRKNELMITLT